jgi:hypothetical protein
MTTNGKEFQKIGWVAVEVTVSIVSIMMMTSSNSAAVLKETTLALVAKAVEKVVVVLRAHAFRVESQDICLENVQIKKNAHLEEVVLAVIEMMISLEVPRVVAQDHINKIRTQIISGLPLPLLTWQ